MYPLFLILSAALTALTARAAPVDFGELFPRGQYPNEVVFLSHCYGNQEDQGTLFAYYQNLQGYPNGQIPDSWAVINDGSQVAWEGKTYTGTFQGNGAGTRGTSKIAANAGSMTRHTLAGSFSNSYGQAFNCYKDSERWLYNCYTSPVLNGKKTDCYSEYWCYDAN